MIISQDYSIYSWLSVHSQSRVLTGDHTESRKVVYCDILYRLNWRSLVSHSTNRDCTEDDDDASCMVPFDRCKEDIFLSQFTVFSRTQELRKNHAIL